MRKVFSLGVLFLILSFTTVAQKPVTIFELCPGVIVDLDHSLVYVMSAEGGVDAVDLERGTRVWHTTDAAKPLALQDGLLICQAEPSAVLNRLRIVVLDTRHHARRVVTGVAELPAGVQASIDETLNTSFTAAARVSDGTALVGWSFTRREIRGMSPAPEETSKGQAAAQPIVSTGAVRMDLSTGTVTLAKADDARPLLAARRPDVPIAQRLAHVPGPQFVAANERTVLTSERVGNDSVWEKYRWTIYDRLTGQRLGEFRAHLSLAPFFVLGSHIVYETGPAVRRTEKGVVDEPIEIRAVDLRSGQELWKWQFRDTTFRGPFPP